MPLPPKMINLIDSHAHLTFKELAGSLNSVLRRSSVAGVTKCITIGTDAEQNTKVIAIIDEYENLFGSVGIHPHYASDVLAADIEEMKELAKHKKIVAIGETGLDFHYNFSTCGELSRTKPDAQKDLFKALLEIAAERKLPVIIHSRDAFDETIEIIDKFADKNTKIVFHCWGGTADQTKIVLDKGFYISFTGVITFKNAQQTRNAAKIVPLEKMMIETDCPYMSPEPFRKQKINEPALLIHIAQKIAELKQVSLESFADAVAKTTKQFFNLP
ncbi:MAG: TatD family hydrolase [Planctomycetes bacterium]|nr:TatD family hydrolase [Planctomycetota bacterium]MBU2458635.1 TatD family hydrolase [Planctomycetota bacterium]MBU2596542.1 TatD family hydrolase [Planctomycetota bacterium]